MAHRSRDAPFGGPWRHEPRATSRIALPDDRRTLALVRRAKLAPGQRSPPDARGRGHWIDRALPFERAHFLTGFPQADGKFHFKPDWKKVGPGYARIPAIADWSADYERSDAEHHEQNQPVAGGNTDEERQANRPWFQTCFPHRSDGIA